MEYLFIYLLQVAEYLHKLSPIIMLIALMVWFTHCLLCARGRETGLEKNI